MIEEKYRKEVWSRNEPYMADHCTTVDLEPCCKKNKNRVEDQEKIPVQFFSSGYLTNI